MSSLLHKLSVDLNSTKTPKYFGTVFWIIAINIFIFIISQFNNGNNWYYLADRIAMTPEKVYKEKWIWTFISYMFLHGNLWHLIFNMFGVLVFGYYVEKHIDSINFLLLYFITGTLASIFSFIIYLITGNHQVMLIGSGGALYALILAYAVFFQDTKLYIFGIIPLRTPVLALGVTAIELFNSVVFRNIAHLTNLSGIIFAWLFIVIRFGINPWDMFKFKS